MYTFVIETNQSIIYIKLKDIIEGKNPCLFQSLKYQLLNILSPFCESMFVNEMSEMDRTYGGTTQNTTPSPLQPNPPKKQKSYRQLHRI